MKFSIWVRLDFLSDQMGEVQEPKFFCKFCNKACFTGKSLGGHMRCHLDLIAAAKKQKLKPEDSEAAGKDHGEDLGVSEESMAAKNQERGKRMSFGEGGDQATSYGLREKPLKSWKVSDPKHSHLKKKKDLCKECGKSFASVKALAGHLKCHSRKGSEEEEHHLCKKCGKGFDSIRALYGHMKIHSKRSRTSNEEESVQSLSDFETMRPVRKKRSTIRYKLTPANPPFSSAFNESHSAVSEFEEVQDAAMCLMMLSRGVKSWNEFVSANETLIYESQSFFCKEEMLNSDDDDDKHSISWRNISEICINIEQFKKPERVQKDEAYYDFLKPSSSKKASIDLHYLEMGETSTTLENCLPADSGITAKNAEMIHISEVKAKLEARPDCSLSTMEMETVVGAVMATIPESTTRSNKEHACPVCFKVFQSGQALGGHKRAHYTANIIETKVKKENLSDIHEFLDLNLPVNAATGTAMDAAMENSRLWCIGSGGVGNPLLISN